jgi:succinoglycan biosynthesis protein ExoU
MWMYGIMRTPDGSGPKDARVAVIIAAWRAEATIGRAVSSALAQPETAEVLVIDDGSGDGGRTVAAALAADDGSGRLVVRELMVNSGPAAARNDGLSVSTAPWVAILDSDDFFLPGRLAHLFEQCGASADLLADNPIQIETGEAPESGRRLWFRNEPPAPIKLTLGYFLEANIPHPDRPRGELGFIKPVMKRDFLDRHHIRYREDLRLGEDMDLYARALIKGADFRLIPDGGYVSVIRRGSLSETHERAVLAAYRAASHELLVATDPGEDAGRAARRHIASLDLKLAWIDFMQALKGGRPGEAVRIMMHDRQHGLHILRGLWHILIRRIGRRA